MPIHETLHLNIFGLNFRIPGHDCITLNACSRSRAVNKYLHMKTKDFMHRRNKRATHEYTSFQNPSAETSGLHMKRLRSIIHSLCSTAGLREQ